MATSTLKLLGSYACKTWGFSRLTWRAQRKKIYCRPHSSKNASTSRARTAHHSHKHPGPRGWASRICGSEQIWSFMDSMREELSSLINNQSWTLVNLPPGGKAIRCAWIYKAKKSEHGAVYCLKSRLVAKRHSRDPESTIMTPSRLLNTKWFTDSSLIL